MGFRFRKNIRIFPGVKLNISKSGISVSLGIPGATVNLGKHGARTTVGLPGTGLSYSVFTPYGQRAPDGNNASQPTYPDNGADVAGDDSIARNVESVDTKQLTSATLTGVQDEIVKAASQQQELASALKECISESLVRVKGLQRKRSWYGSLLFWVNETKLAAEVEELAEEREKLQTAFDLSQIDVSFDMDRDGQSLFGEVEQAFDRLTGSVKKWDIIQEQGIDAYRERSLADTAVRRRDIRLYRSAYETIKQANVPVLGNANGGEVMVFPGFLLVRSSHAIALVDYAELDIQFINANFTEREEFPRDAQMVSHTWARVNANGTADRRFKDNCKIPVALYGSLLLRSRSGLNEHWMFSNHAAAEQFAEALVRWKNLIVSAMQCGKDRANSACGSLNVDTPAIPALSDGHRKAVIAAIDEDYLDWCLQDLEIAHDGMPIEEKISVLAAHLAVTGEWLLSSLKINQLRAISLAIFRETSGTKTELRARILAYFEGA